MKHNLTSLCTLTAVFIVLYLSGELIEKGHYLNSVTLFPILGYLLWLSAALFLLKVLVLPIYSFLRLTRGDALTHTDLLKRLHRQLKAQRKIPQAERSPQQQEACDAYDDIDTVLKLHQHDASMEERAAELLQKFAHLDTHKAEAEKVVMRYAKTAAVALVLSRNSLLDGLTLLFFQMKMVIELCRVYGYKPSVVFNLACFGWVLLHSVAATVMQDASEAAGDLISDAVIPEIVGEDLITLAPAEMISKFASSLVASLLEGINAGAAVYLTGSIFRACLEGSAKRLGVKDLLLLRREVRVNLCGMILTSSSKRVTEKLTPFA